VINGMLAAAASAGLTVYELEPEQELNLVGYTELARYIVDNSTTPPVDVLGTLRSSMNTYGFVPGRVTYSTPWINSTLAGYDCVAQGTQILNVFSDYARDFGVDEVAAAIGGYSSIGVPGNTNPPQGASTGYLYCGGDTSNMVAGIPMYHPQPTIVDVHVYPCVAGSPICPSTDSAAQVQNEAQIDFHDLGHFWPLLGLPSTTPLVVGETHSNTNSGTGQTCEGAPSDAPGLTVAGYKQSSFPASGLSIVFRPWMELQSPSGDCFTYLQNGHPDNQSVNKNGAGPYAPTQQ
jgi:hypothetical protein